MTRKKTIDMDVATAREVLRGAKLRSTAARIAVLQSLAAAGTPLSHPEVTARLALFGFDQSTVFRALTDLATAGLLARVDLADSSRRFELLSSGHSGESEHPHFMCVDCGKIFCLSDFSFRLAAKKKGTPSPGRVTEVLVKGHCTRCE